MAESGSEHSRPIFVLGFHRGGTTFVQRLLNCHEEVTIWGENAGLVSDLREMLEHYAESPGGRSVATVEVEKYREFSGFADRFTPWASPFTADELAGQVARMLESLYVDAADADHTWGFKEIRYGRREDIDFLCRLFPRCRLVLLVRHPRSLLLSQLFVRWNDGKLSESPRSAVRETIAAYAKTVGAFLDCAERHSPLVTVLRYESLHPDTVIEELFEPLGLSEAGIGRRLLETVFRSRVGSSFVDVGREVGEADVHRVRAAYDELIEPTLSEFASARTLEAVRRWYPRLREESRRHV